MGQLSNSNYTVYRLTRMVKLMLYAAFLLGMTYMVAGLPYYGKHPNYKEIPTEMIKENSDFCIPFCESTGFRGNCQVCAKKTGTFYCTLGFAMSLLSSLSVSWSKDGIMISGYQTYGILDVDCK